MKNSYYFIFIILVNISFCSSEEYIKLISFNINGFKQKKIFNKVNEIIKNIEDFDIVLIQENWSYKTLFLERLKNFKFIFGEKKKSSFLPSGLINSFSKNINIIEYEDKIYANCSGYLFNGLDCLSSKGFIYAKINFNGKIMDIYNTHLDSGNSENDKCARKSQLDELKKFVLRKRSDIPYIICGDFNIDYFGKDKLIIDKFMSDLELNIINSQDEDNSNNKIDYIFYNGINNFMNMDLNDTLYHLSDHYPESILFKLNNKRNY